MQPVRSIFPLIKTLLFAFFFGLILTGNLSAESRNRDNVRERERVRETRRAEVQHNRSKLTLGSENYSRSRSIGGGNYLYAEYGFDICSRLIISSKFSLSLFPDSFTDKLLSLHITYYWLKLQKDFNFSVTASYVYNFQFLNSDYGNIGLDFSLIDSGNFENDFNFRLLPLGVYFNFYSHDFTFRYELIKITFKF